MSKLVQVRELLKQHFDSPVDLEELCQDLGLDTRKMRRATVLEFIHDIVGEARRRNKLDAVASWMASQGIQPEPSGDTSSYDTAAVRELLAIALTDGDIRDLAFDYFRPAYERMSRGMGKGEMVRILVEHCDSHQQMDQLLSLVHQKNPTRYDQYAPRLQSPPPPSTRSARGIGPAPAQKPAEPPGPIRDRWALLVGVNRYVDPAFSPLKFCINDVLALEQALKSLGYTVITLHDDAPEEHLHPTRDNVEAELARLCQVVGPDDLLLVHFACHGKLVNGQPVLITRESRAPTLARKALPLAEVERQMRASQARRLVLTLDACHTGVEIGRDLADPEFIRHAYELAEGFVLFAASTSQQIAQEWDEKEHGVFTYYLLEGLSGQADHFGKRFVTVDDLKNHVLAGLRKWNVQHGGRLQEPNIRAEALGDIILADYRHTLAKIRKPSQGSNTSNLFGDTGRITDPNRFFDRKELLRQIFEELSKGVNLSLVGESQIGKSSILSMVCALGSERMSSPPDAFAYLSLEWVDDEDDFYEALCEALGIETCRGYKLTRALRGRRIVLCLDEVEKMAWDGFTVHLRSQLRGLADGPAAPIKLVIASRSPLAGLFPDAPEMTSPLAGICRPLDVGPFPPDIARAFLAHRLRDTGVAFSESQTKALLEQTRGHPAHLQRAAADLFERYRRTAR